VVGYGVQESEKKSNSGSSRISLRISRRAVSFSSSKAISQNDPMTEVAPRPKPLPPAP
jgi:hypothetical protein